MFRLVFLAILGFYLGSNIYLVRQLSRWLGLGGKWTAALGVVFALLAMGYFLAETVPMPGMLSRALCLLGGTYMAAYIFLIITVPVAHLIVRGKGGPMTAIVILAATLAYAAFGIYSAAHIRTTSYTVQSQKASGLRIALISDMHMGEIIREKQVAEMVEAINRIDADYVLIAGDMFDSGPTLVQNKEAIGALFRSIRSRQGVYACFGNHDGAFRGLEGEAAGLLASWGVQVLQDEIVEPEGVNIIGRKDRGQPRQTVEELMAGVDRGKLNIMLDHQPYELEQAGAAGVDLLLCGHTHAGQVFPINYITRSMYKIDYGMLQEEGLTTIVSSGAGTWGPRMRVATVSEVVEIIIE